jgi:catechol O-methyltransferase
MNLKQRMPFLRWSVWRLAVGTRNITTTGQIGDGREAAAADCVISNARRGDIDDVLAAIDRFAYEKSVLINVGDEKGALLDAGVDDRVTCVVGTIGDDGKTLDALGTDHGFTEGDLDFMFIDHDKDAYLTDLLSIVDRGWLHPGSIVVADNVRFPGASKYRSFVCDQQGKKWDTVEHKTHVEYQTLVPDLVLESTYLG